MGIPVVASVLMIGTVNDHNIAASQSPGAAGNLTLNGTAVANGVATLVSSGAATVIITSGGNDSAKTFTIYGTDESGIPQSEALAGTNATIATSVLYYKTVSRVAINAASAGTVKVGMSGVGVSRWVNYNIHAEPCTTAIVCTKSGTVNYDLQYTYDDLTTNASPTLFTDPGASGATGNVQATYSFPITWARVKLNSGSGTVTMTSIQAGLVGA